MSLDVFFATDVEMQQVKNTIIFSSGLFDKDVQTSYFPGGSFQASNVGLCQDIVKVEKDWIINFVLPFGAVIAGTKKNI